MGRPAALAQRLARAWCLATCALCLVALPTAALAQASKEYQIKMAFLYNFTKFVEWPAQGLTRPDSSFVIGLYCPDEVQAELVQIVRGRKINGREVVAKKFESANDAMSAQLLFVCASGDAQFPRIRAALGASPVLTVGESEAVRKSGMIVFTLQEDKVRFEINVEAAERSGIRIGAQLLKLATAVRRSP